MHKRYILVIFVTIKLIVIFILHKEIFCCLFNITNKLVNGFELASANRNHYKKYLSICQEFFTIILNIAYCTEYNINNLKEFK